MLPAVMQEELNDMGLGMVEKLTRAEWALVCTIARCAGYDRIASSPEYLDVGLS